MVEVVGRSKSTPSTATSPIAIRVPMGHSPSRRRFDGYASQNNEAADADAKPLTPQRSTGVCEILKVRIHSNDSRIAFGSV